MSWEAQGRTHGWLLAALVAAMTLLGAGAAQASDPSIGVRPGGISPVYAQATAESGADGVHLNLRWEQVEGVAGVYDWRWPDWAFRNFELAGVPVESVRVVDPPGWAVAGGRCADRFKSCPPAASHYADFRDFVQALVTRYGPTGTVANVPRFVLWNEPNLAAKWGGRTVGDGSYRQYSDLLARFYAGAVAASPEVAVDAGELAAGDDRPPEWARKFTTYSSERGRNGHYDVLAIHAYSADPDAFVRKIKNYQALRGVNGVAVTEFAWAVGKHNRASGGGDYKCTNDSSQRAKLRQTVEAVRERTSEVDRLVWLDLIDTLETKEPKCLDNTGYYDRAVRDEISTYGLHKRAPDGSLDQLVARPILDVFRRLAAG